MAKIAVDIVLLPPREIMDKAIEMNKELLKSFDGKVILNKENCLPHISLAMGCIEIKDIPNIEKILQEIAKQFPPMDLSIIDIHAERIPTGKKVSFFAVKKTKELQLLHEAVMRKLLPYFTYDATISMVHSPQDVERVTLFWIKNYPTKSSFKKFFPHITIGFGKTNKVKFPIKFIVSKFALCHLGNYCTCRKILMLADLES